MKTTSPKQQKLRINKKTALAWTFLLLLSIIAFWFYRDSLEEIFAGIRNLSFKNILFSAGLAGIYYALEGLIIYEMAVSITPEYKAGYGIATAYRCEFYRMITMGSGSGLAEIYYLSKDGVKPGRGTSLTMLQFVMKKIAVMLWGVSGFLLLLHTENASEICRNYGGFMIAGCVITVGIVIVLLTVVLSEKVMSRILWLCNKLSHRFPSKKMKLKEWKEQVELLNRTGKELLTYKKSFWKVIAYNLLKLFVLYAIPAYLLWGKSQLPGEKQIFWGESILLMAVVYMLAGVIPAPSGIGSLEFVFLLFFGQFAETGTTVPTILLFRFVTWILPFGVGGIIIAGDKCSEYRKNHSKKLRCNKII